MSEWSYAAYQYREAMIRLRHRNYRGVALRLHWMLRAIMKAMQVRYNVRVKIVREVSR